MSPAAGRRRRSRPAGQPEHHQGEELRRPEIQRDGGERRGREDQHHGCDGAADERADRGDGERGAAAARFRHLVAVDRRDGGGALAGHVHQHGGDRAAIHGAVVDRRQHDDRAGRIELEGQRQQDCDAGDRPDARQHADRGADDAADEGRTAGSRAAAPPRTRDKAPEGVHARASGRGPAPLLLDLAEDLADLVLLGLHLDGGVPDLRARSCTR